MTCQHNKKNYKPAKHAKFCQRIHIHEYSPLWRTTIPFILLLSFSFFLQRLVSEKFHFKRRIPTLSQGAPRRFQRQNTLTLRLVFVRCCLLFAFLYNFACVLVFSFSLSLLSTFVDIFNEYIT